MGLFVTFEGPDGCGKSTISNLIYEYLLNSGLDVIKTREPGGTPIGEEIRDIILNRENDVLSHRTEALLYAASRAQHVEEKILPALDEGKIVLCERFGLSSLAYQGFGRRLNIEDIVQINDFATQGLKPHITFLFNIDPLVSLERKLNESADRLELAGDDFHKQVFEGYKKLENLYKESIVAVDASKSIDEVFSFCLNIIKSKMEV